MAYTNLTSLYQTSVATYPDNPLFGLRQSDGTWNWVTYADFGDLVDNARGGLASLGITARDRVAIISDNRVEWAAGAYATYGLQAAWVPMYEAQQPKEWKYILGDSGAKVVIVAGDNIREKVDLIRPDLPAVEQIVVIGDQAGGDAITWDELVARGAANPVDPVDPAGSDLAGLIYTSGTTGNPKGVMLSHDNLASNVSAVMEVFPLDPEDRSCSFLPWAHSFGQTIELHTLVAFGASSALSGAKTLMRDMPEVQPTILISVPTVFNKIYDGLHKMMDAKGGASKAIFNRARANARKRADLATSGKTTRWVEIQHGLYDKLVFTKVRDAMGGHLKYAFSGGAAISTEVAEFISAVGITVYEGYGLTETSPVVSANVRGHRRIGSVGRAVPGVTISIDDENSPVDGIGEIVVHGSNVLQGYYNLPDEDAKVFTGDGGFRTGDLGSVDEDGYLYIRGRIKEQYKLENGKYVVPSPIEEQLNLSGYVATNMVYGEQRPYNVALIIPDEEAVVSWAAEHDLPIGDYNALLATEEIRDLIKGEVARTQQPIKSYERVRDFLLAGEEWTPENGMLTPSLKVKRRAVMAKHGNELEALYPTER